MLKHDLCLSETGLAIRCTMSGQIGAILSFILLAFFKVSPVISSITARFSCVVFASAGSVC